MGIYNEEMVVATPYLFRITLTNIILNEYY